VILEAWMSETLKFAQGKLQTECASCGKLNSVPVAKILQGPVCGSCKAKLSVPDRPVEADDGNFSHLIGDSPVPVLVDFWAPWCGPCHMMTPILEEASQEWEGKIKICKLNVDEAMSVARDYQIQSIPTVILFESGEPAKRIVGARPKKAFVEEFQGWL
jgi:thioredoxin